MPMKGSFIERGGLWVVIQGAIMTSVLVLSLTLHATGYNRAWIVAGAICIALGVVFGIAGTWSLGSNLTPFPKPMTKARLVTQGIYALVRHPLYTGVTLLALGWSLVWQSMPACATALTLGLFFDIKARSEERWLHEKFEEYQDYCLRTRKFIPWIY